MPKEIYTKVRPEQLDSVAKHIGECAAQLKALAEIVRQEQFETINTKAWGQTNRGVQFMDAFISFVRDALWNARQARGDIPAAPEKNGQRPRPKKGAK